MKKARFLLIAAVLVTNLLLSLKLNAQQFDLAVQTSYVKFNIDWDAKVSLNPKQYDNKGFEFGPVVSFRPKSAPFAFHTGLLYDVMYHESYTLNFLNVPVGLDIVMGSKAGAILGFGMKFRNLLKVPKGFLAYYSEDQMNRFLLSYTARIGAFFKVGKLRFQLFPQVELFRDPLYHSTSYKNIVYDFYVSMASLNLTVSFLEW